MTLSDLEWLFHAPCAVSAVAEPLVAQRIHSGYFLKTTNVAHFYKLYSLPVTQATASLHSAGSIWETQRNKGAYFKEHNTRTRSLNENNKLSISRSTSTQPVYDQLTAEWVAAVGPTENIKPLELNKCSVECEVGCASRCVTGSAWFLNTCIASSRRSSMRLCSNSHVWFLSIMIIIQSNWVTECVGFNIPLDT